VYRSIGNRLAACAPDGLLACCVLLPGNRQECLLGAQTWKSMFPLASDGEGKDGREQWKPNRLSNLSALAAI
jgi:hypothetical protein